MTNENEKQRKQTFAEIIEQYGMNAEQVEFYQNYSKEEVIVQILLINAYAKSQSVYCDIYIKTLANTTDTLTYEVLS